MIAYDQKFPYSFKYPLWNRDFSNKVYYIKCELHKGENWEDVLRDWEKSIDELDVDFWVSGRDTESSEAARRKPEKFRQIKITNQLALFQVIKEPRLEAGDEAQTD